MLEFSQGLLIEGLPRLLGVGHDGPNRHLLVDGPRDTATGDVRAPVVTLT
jgi:hypothetical protein